MSGNIIFFTYNNFVMKKTFWNALFAVAMIVGVIATATYMLLLALPFSILLHYYFKKSSQKRSP